MKKYLLGIATGLMLSLTSIAFANIAIQVPFDDVDDSDWYANYANNLKYIGIIDGYSDNTFRGNNTVNRAELAKFIYETYVRLTTKGEFQVLKDKYEALNSKVNALDLPGDCYYEDQWYQAGDYVNDSARCIEDGRVLEPSSI